mgnify:CR=1 FL=1
MTDKRLFAARVLYALYLLCAMLIVILVMCAPPLRLLPPPPAPLTPVTPIAIITITPPPPPASATPSSTLTSTPTIHPTRTLTPSSTLVTPLTASPTIEFVTRTPIATIVPGRVTLPTTGASATDLFFSGALQPLGEIQFPFTLAEFLAYLAGGILTYPASKFIFEKVDEWLPDLFGLPKLSRAQKRFLAYPIAALIAVGATVLLHYLGYAPLSMDALYKAFGTAFLTAQALHGYFDLTGADPAVESKNALVNLFAAVKGFQFAHVDARFDYARRDNVSEQGELRERYLDLLNAAAEAENFLRAGAKKK